MEITFSFDQLTVSKYLDFNAFSIGVFIACFCDAVIIVWTVWTTGEIIDIDFWEFLYYFEYNL